MQWNLNRGKIIAAASFFVGFVVYFWGSPVWYGDSQTYFNYAGDLAHLNYNPHLYYRTIGYPAMMLLTGATSGNLEGLFFLQCVVASSIAPMIYLTLAPFSRQIAFGVAAVAIISLIPYQFALTVYPDVFYVAGSVLLTLLVSRWMLGQGGAGLIYLIVATTLFLTWIRPVGLLLAILCVPALLYRRRTAVHVAICAVLFIGSNIALHHWQSHFGSSRSMLGRQVFLNVYMNGIDTSLPRVVKLRQTLVDAGGDAEKIAQDLKKPTVAGYWRLFGIAEVAPVDLDGAFLRASITQVLHHPGQFLDYFFWHYQSFVVGPTWRYEAYTTTIEPWQFAPANPWQGEMTPAGTYRPIKNDRWKRPVSLIMEAAGAVFSTLYPVVMPLSFVLMLFGSLMTLRTRGTARTISLTALAMHTVNIAALAALCDPRLRYHVQNVPLAVIGAGVGIPAVITLLQKWMVTGEIGDRAEHQGLFAAE